MQSAFGADAQQTYRESTDALYNLDFSTAQSGFEGLTRDYPENPDYWNALASSIWLKIIYDQQKLNIESFSGNSTFGTKDSRESVNPADERRLRETIATAITKADAILRKKPNDVAALYAKGVSNATLASFEGTAKRSYLSAHARAKTARSLHQQVLKLDPNFNDARLAVGIYDYVVGVIPGYFRWLLGMFGVRGDGKEAGIRQLEIAADKGQRASTDAKMLLIVVYNREKRFDQALRFAADLHAQYPRNFLFEMSRASIYGKMKKWDDAVETYRAILAKVTSRQNGYERLRAERVNYELGRSDIERYQFEEALDYFGKVVAGMDGTTDEKANAHLWMGKIFDSKKDRAHALEHYNALTRLDCDPQLKEEAERFKRRPFVG